MKVRVERPIGSGILSIETGLLAKQAAGSCLVQFGETAVLTGENRAVTSRGGKEATSHSRFVAVYAARNGKLQLVHFQSVGL